MKNKANTLPRHHEGKWGTKLQQPEQHGGVVGVTSSSWGRHRMQGRFVSVCQRVKACITKVCETCTSGGLARNASLLASHRLCWVWCRATPALPVRCRAAKRHALCMVLAASSAGVGQGDGAACLGDALGGGLDGVLPHAVSTAGTAAKVRAACRAAGRSTRQQGRTQRGTLARRQQQGRRQCQAYALAANHGGHVHVQAPVLLPP